MTISQVAKKTGLSEHTLRFYEKDGLIPNVGRNGSGRREYSEENLGTINFIQKLKSTGMPLKQIKAYISLIDKNEDSYIQRMEILEQHKMNMEIHLKETREFLKYITHKIEWYKNNAKLH